MPVYSTVNNGCASTALAAKSNSSQDNKDKGTFAQSIHVTYIYTYN